MGFEVLDGLGGQVEPTMSSMARVCRCDRKECPECRGEDVRVVPGCTRHWQFYLPVAYKRSLERWGIQIRWNCQWCHLGNASPISRTTLCQHAMLRCAIESS